jgi:hypothetical protein
MLSHHLRPYIDIIKFIVNTNREHNANFNSPLPSFIRLLALQGSILELLRSLKYRITPNFRQRWFLESGDIVATAIFDGAAHRLIRQPRHSDKAGPSYHDFATHDIE